MATCCRTDKILGSTCGTFQSKFTGLTGVGAVVTVSVDLDHASGNSLKEKPDFGGAIEAKKTLCHNIDDDSSEAEDFEL